VPVAPALDTLRSITTPEGVELNLRLAGPVPRACAWAIDLGLRIVVLIVLSIVLGQLGRLGMGLLLICAFLLEWLYPTVCELKLDGSTPGKRWMGLRVVNDDGTPLTVSAAVVRNLLRAVDFLPVMYGFGLIAMLINREFRRLGDLVAGTVVVYREAARAPAVIPRAAPVPPERALSVEEARAILDCAERIPQLTHERADELARLAEPLIGVSGAGHREHVLGVANYLVGRTSR
jgi:uncharacterized RDD family membrane protein YckC